jgi:predicted transcriptional regulator
MSKTKNNKNVVHVGKVKPDTNKLLAELASELISKHPELLDEDYFKSQLASATGLTAAAVLGVTNG